MASSSGGTKRPSSDSDGGPAPKKPALLIPTLDIGPVTGEEDLDVKVLKVKIHPIALHFMKYFAHDH